MSSIDHSISYSLGSKNSLLINWVVSHLDKSVDSTLTSFIPRKNEKKERNKILDLASRLNRSRGTKTEHLEIKIVRFALCSVARSNNKKVPKAVFGRAVNFYRLRLSDLFLSLIYRPLSSLVENIDWKYYKRSLERYNQTIEKNLSWEDYKAMLFTAQEIEEGRFYPETRLNQEQLILWNILCSFSNLDTKLRRFSKYSSNDYNEPIIRRPSELAILIERVFSATDISNSEIADFLQDVKRFHVLYKRVIGFERSFENRLDCCFYSIVHIAKVQKKFRDFLKHEIEPENKLFLLEAISSHPLKDLVIPYSNELKSSISDLVSVINEAIHEI